jgi:hypothetical protein
MNTRKINMMESFTTYENHGELQLNFEYFPELVGKTDEEIQNWLYENDENLFVHIDTCELRKDNKYIYSEEEIQEAKEEGEELEECEDEEVVSLWDYWSESEVNWDKIKNEKKYLYLC